MRLDRGMDTVTDSLITTFDYVWDRLAGRLSGLTDEEYFWEPVAGCWSLRQDDQGRWQLDGGGGGGPAPDPAPATWPCTYSTRSPTTAPRLACSETYTRSAPRSAPRRGRRIALRASCCYLAGVASAEFGAGKWRERFLLLCEERPRSHSAFTGSWLYNFQHGYTRWRDE
jgi:hypothetical protein